MHDAQAVAVRLFDSTGAFVRSVGRKGGGPGEYDHLNGLVALADDRLLLWDASGARLNFYTPAGDFLETVRMPVTGSYGQGMLHADTAGTVFADAIIFRDPADRAKTRRGLIRMSLSGEVHDSTQFIEWREPAPTLRAQSKDGGSNITYGLPYSPQNSNRIAPNGSLVSGPGDPYVFYILPRAGGRPRKVVREFVPVPVSPTEATERRQQVEEAMLRVDPTWSWSGPTVPSHKPAYRSFEVGRDGRIWVLISQPAEVIPTAELAPVREGAPPTVRFTTREPLVYDVFSPDGELLGRVALPSLTRLSTMRGPYVWGVQRDSLDVEYAVRFRINPPLPPPG